MNTTRYQACTLRVRPESKTKSSPCVFCVFERLSRFVARRGGAFAHDDETRRAARHRRRAVGRAAPRRARRRARGGRARAGAARGADPTDRAPRASNDTRACASRTTCSSARTARRSRRRSSATSSAAATMTSSTSSRSRSCRSASPRSTARGGRACTATTSARRWPTSCARSRSRGDYSALADGRRAVAAWPFIECMEFASGDPAAADGCLAAAPGVNASAVRACYAAEFDDVMHAAGAVTGELCNEPSGCLEWTPWVTIDGVQLPWGASGSPGYHDEKLIDAICNAYEGEPPASCTNSSPTAPPSSVAAAVATRAEFPRARAGARRGRPRAGRARGGYGAPASPRGAAHPPPQAERRAQSRRAPAGSSPTIRGYAIVSPRWRKARARRARSRAQQCSPDVGEALSARARIARARGGRRSPRPSRRARSSRFDEGSGRTASPVRSWLIPAPGRTAREASSSLTEPYVLEPTVNCLRWAVRRGSAARRFCWKSGLDGC